MFLERLAVTKPFNETYLPSGADIPSAKQEKCIKLDSSSKFRADDCYEQRRFVCLKSKDFWYSE